jgi:Transmembrane amino acid transporter protein
VASVCGCFWTLFFQSFSTTRTIRMCGLVYFSFDVILSLWYRDVGSCSGICSSTLPIPFAFSRLGLLLGISTMALVASCNAISSHVLLRAAGKFHHDSYEGVAEAAGGRTLKVRGPSLIYPAYIRTPIIKQAVMSHVWLIMIVLWHIYPCCGCS